MQRSFKAKLEFYCERCKKIYFVVEEAECEPLFLNAGIDIVGKHKCTAQAEYGLCKECLALGSNA